MEDQSEKKEIQIVCHIPEKLHVLCDRDLAQRVVVNLIHNALKWSPKGEAITISAEAEDQSDEVTISVLDNGPGVPPEMVDRIFERFYQVDVSRSGGEGTGLGLAICRHIVEAHGGRIWAEGNADGGGGRFRFTLLSAPEHEEAAEKPQPVE
jgi:two-component system phosphate regulon sensor histidine kinase PhoR